MTGAASPGDAAADAYPEKAVRIVLPFPPGGSSDSVTRIVADKMSAMWGKPVVLEHRPGAGTTIGAAYVAKSPADGYTLYLCGVISHVSSGALYRNLSYDTRKSFEAIGTIAISPFVLVANPLVLANNLGELVALAKSKPGVLNYASTGSGGAPHLATEIFARAASIKIMHVPYAMPSALGAVLGHQVDFMIADVSAIPMIRNGKLKALAVTTARQSPLLQGVPTFGEAGVPGVEVPNVQGFVAPAGTPRDIVSSINSAMAKALAMEEVRQRFHSLGMEPYPGTPEELDAFIAGQLRQVTQVISDAGVKLN
jgi:tripartite-type tricarboxylate transporter receptor subunit TctC